MVPGSRRYRFLYTVWGFFESLSFGGLIYGWGSLVYILKNEGLYYYLCPSNSNVSVHLNAPGDLNDTYFVNTSHYDLGNQSSATNDTRSFSRHSADDCPEQNNRLNLAFTIAMGTFCAGAFIMGQINFKFGIRMARLVATIVFIAGALMLAFMSNDVPFLIFPGLSMIGAGGIAFFMTNMQLANLFPRGGSIVVGLMCGGFDASSGVQLLVKIGYENGISRQTAFIALACANLLTLISTFFFMPKDFIKKAPTARSDEVANDKDAAVELTRKGAEVEEQEDNKPSIKDCMLSPVYIIHVLWLSILQLRFYLFLGSLNTTLELLVESKSVSYYTNVFMYILMCGLITSPFAGIFCAFFNRLYLSSQSPTRRTLMPLVIPLALTISLCIMLSALMLISGVATLYAAFVFLLLFRSFMYTLAAGLIGAVFPGEYFAIMYGILTLTAGIISMFQYALFTWAEFAGFMPVNVFLTALMVITYVHPLYLWFKCRRDDTSGTFSLVK